MVLELIMKTVCLLICNIRLFYPVFYLVIQAPGSYEFRVETRDQATVSLDGALVIDTQRGKRAAKVKLTQGEHPIQAVFRRENPRGLMIMRLYWKTPGNDEGPAEIIPRECLRPAMTYGEGTPFPREAHIR